MGKECPIPDVRDQTATAAEVDVLAGVTAGTGAASKAVVLDASGNVALPGVNTMVADGLVLTDSSGNTHTVQVDASGNLTATA